MRGVRCGAGRLGQASEVQVHWEQACAGGMGASPAAHAARVVALVSCLRSRDQSRSKKRATPRTEHQLGMVCTALDEMVGTRPVTLLIASKLMGVYLRPYLCVCRYAFKV